MYLILTKNQVEIFYWYFYRNLKSIKNDLFKTETREEEKNKPSENEKQESENKAINDKDEEFDDKVMLKLLRLLEIFTAIAVKNKEIKQFVLQVTRPIQILSLANLLMKCKWEHGIIILKVISNLIVVGLERSTIDEAFVMITSTPLGKEISEVSTQAQFDD